MKITFKEICKQEPQVLALYKVMEKIAGKRGHPDGDWLWYHFKFQMCMLVGMGRKNTRKRQQAKAKRLGPKAVNLYMGYKFILSIDELALRVKIHAGAPYLLRPIPQLETSKAYDVAYKALYELICSGKRAL